MQRLRAADEFANNVVRRSRFSITDIPIDDNFRVDLRKYFADKQLTG